MPFPVSYRRSFTIEDEAAGHWQVQAAIKALEQWALDAGARRIQPYESGLLFRGGMMSFLTDWRTSTSKRMTIGWNRLIPISLAKVDLQRVERGLAVTYSFTFIGLLLLTLVLISLFVGLRDSSEAMLLGLQVNLWMAMGWAGVFIAGYFLSAYGVGKAIENVCREAVKKGQD